MPSDTTNPTAPPSRRHGPPPEPDVAVLVVLFCRPEPWRVGQAIPFPDLDIETYFGRGHGEGREVRAELWQQRPTGHILQPPPSDKSLSRRLLKITATGHPLAEPRLEVEILEGSERPRAMRVNGRPVRRAVVGPGDTIAVRGEEETKLLLYCTLRPRVMRTLYPDAGGFGPFGQPDAAGIVGESWARWQLRERLAFAALAGEHVLLRGPSGAGKELAARLLHLLSKRSRGPFVARNAATFTETLINQELFGNLRGYPNPGMLASLGLFGQAHGGTLFLDEIGELPLWLQANLLRVMDAGGEYTVLGASAPSHCDVWIIGATNRRRAELKHDFAARLRADIVVPGLNERKEDIPLLVQHYVLQLAKKAPEAAGRFVAVDARGGQYARVAPALLERLVRWTYTTHVRELDSLVSRAIAESPGTTIELTPGLAELAADGKERASQAEPKRSPEDEEQLLRVICDGSYGSKAKAARVLGKSRQQIDRLLVKYGIEVPERGKGGKE